MSKTLVSPEGINEQTSLTSGYFSIRPLATSICSSVSLKWAVKLTFISETLGKTYRTLHVEVKKSFPSAELSAQGTYTDLHPR